MEKLDILELIEQKKYIQLKKELSEMNEVDISEILDPLDLQTTLLVFRMLPKDTAAEVFSYISPEQKADIINAIASEIQNSFLDGVVCFSSGKGIDGIILNLRKISQTPRKK